MTGQGCTEDNGAAVCVGDGDFVQTRDSEVFRALFRRGIPLGPRPLEGERAGGACGDNRDAAGGGGAADALDRVYTDFCMGNTPCQKK